MARGGAYTRGHLPPQEDHEWFVRENAVALLKARDAKIARMRREIAKLHKAVASLREELRRSRGRP